MVSPNASIYSTMCTMAFSTVRGGHNVVKVEDIEGPLTVGMKMLPLQVCNGPVGRIPVQAEDKIFRTIYHLQDAGFLTMFTFSG